MNGQTSWTIEYGALTTRQVAAGHDSYVVCNLNIILLHGGKPIGNVIGNKVIRSKKDGKYYFSSNSAAKSNGYFNFSGFNKPAKDAIIKKALEHEKNGTLLRRWSVRFEYNPKPKALTVQDGAVKEESPSETSAFAG